MKGNRSVQEELYCGCSDGRLRETQGGAIVAAGNQRWIYECVMTLLQAGIMTKSLDVCTVT